MMLMILTSNVMVVEVDVVNGGGDIANDGD